MTITKNKKHKNNNRSIQDSNLYWHHIGIESCPKVPSFHVHYQHILELHESKTGEYKKILLQNTKYLPLSRKV